jgi:hypothetical protein
MTVIPSVSVGETRSLHDCHENGKNWCKKLGSIEPVILIPNEGPFACWFIEVGKNEQRENRDHDVIISLG